MTSPLGLSRTLVTAALVATAVVLLIGLFGATGSEKLGHDFRAAYFPAAEAIRDGESPYATPDDTEWWLPYVYPPQLAMAVLPTTALGKDLAALLAVLACIGAVSLALALVGVRDARCYAAVVLWAPAWNAFEMANVSALLALGLALAWRFRITVWPLATTLGLAVSTKLFLWPVLVWAVVRGRGKAAALAVAIGAAVSLATWAAIGFDGFASYPDQLDRIDSQSSYSIRAMAVELGYTETVGTIVMALVGGALLVATVSLGRRGDDVRAFTCVIAASLALTPVVWQHYLVLLVVPLALSRPRFGAIWLLPALLWLSPRAGNGEGLEPFLPAIVATILLVVLLTRPSPRPERAVAAPA
jgi:alpha-1,2-mannosyltransferase